MESSRLPIDRGYSWVVCAGACMIYFVTTGVFRSLGIMLIEFQEHFQSDPKITSLTVALVAAGFYMFVIFSNTMGLFFGNRNIAMVGASLAFVSMLLTAFAPNIICVVIFTGLLSGLAYSGLFATPLIILSSYFQTRRALATGIAGAGGSLGNLAIPLIFNGLVKYYGFQGGILIFSGVVLHGVPASMLLRPPNFWNDSRTTRSHSITTNDPSQQDSACKRFGNVLRVMMDKELLCSPIFQLMSASAILGQLGIFSSMIFLPSCAKAFFNNNNLSVILVSVMGLFDLFGRILGGYIADLRILKTSDIAGLCLLLQGVVILSVGLFPTVWLMFASAVSIGLFTGASRTLLTTMIIEIFGLAKVSSGFGILTFLMGLFLIPSPTVLSVIFMATGTYKSVLIISGGFLLTGGVMYLMIRLVVVKAATKAQAMVPEKEGSDIIEDTLCEECDRKGRNSELGSAPESRTKHVVKEDVEEEQEEGLYREPQTVAGYHGSGRLRK